MSVFHPLVQALRYLDQNRFLGLPIWEFGFRSLFHRYGQVFLWKMALPHPTRCYRAIRRARKVWNTGFRNGVWNVGKRESDRYDLVAASYCQKPAGSDGSCPEGRFNHRCRIAENRTGQPTGICTACPIKAIVDLARHYAADFYIMTSGLDLANHLFLPSIRGSGTQRGLFFLCAYSSYPFLLAMLLARIEGDLLTFCHEDCVDYHDFSLADRGQKPTQTRIESGVWSRFVPEGLVQRKGRFERREEVYHYMEEREYL